MSPGEEGVAHVKEAAWLLLFSLSYDFDEFSHHDVKLGAELESSPRLALSLKASPGHFVLVTFNTSLRA